MSVRLHREITAYGSEKITLMTPQPDSGLYKQAGAETFVRHFGVPTGDDTLYFTGTHRVGKRCKKTGLTAFVRRYDIARNCIADVEGAVEL